MRILFYELKKIFEFKKVLILIGICFIIFQMYISFYFKYFPNGSEKYAFNLSLQMLNDYGSSMDEEEYGHFKGRYEQEKQEANQYIMTDNRFADAGVSTYDQFRNMELDSEKQEALNFYIMLEKNVELFWVLGAREYIMERYESIDRDRIYLNKQQLNRFEQLLQTGAITSIFPDFVHYNYDQLISWTAILILISIMFMIAPVYIRDRINRVQELQYASRTGRNLFVAKLAASLVAAFIIITIELACLFALYAGNQTSPFFPVNINSFFNIVTSWYDLTFLQYIILTVAIVYVLGAVITLVIAFLSSVSPNYITVIGAQVPIAFLLFGMGLNYMLERSTSIYLPQWIQPLCLASLAAVSVFLIFLRWNREKVSDK